MQDPDKTIEEAKKERSKFHNERKKARRNYARYLTYKRQSELAKKRQTQDATEYIKNNIKIKNLDEAIKGEIQ